MRLLALLVPPLLFAIPFAACSGNSPAGSADAGVDSSNDVSDDFAIDIPMLGDAEAGTNCALSGDADPVGLCVQQMALLDLHEKAFVAGKGAATSWSSTTLVPDPGDGGVVPYTLDDTVAYAAAATNYLASAELYGNSVITGQLTTDLTAIALQLESTGGFEVPATEYSGELYFHLRTAAGGLRTSDLTTDGNKFDDFAEAYGRSLLTAHFFALASSPASGDAGGHDAGHVEAGAGVADGIFGNAVGAGQIAYAPGDVATAAYALLDMVNRYPTDPSVPAWLHAVRASLEHLESRAKEPTTGMFYQALLASTSGSGGDSGTTDPLAPSTDPTLPSDAVTADTQATFVLAMVRAKYLVTTGTQAIVPDGGFGPDSAIVDAGVTGPFVPILDLPLEGWADTIINAMNGTRPAKAGDAGGGGPSLWDSTASAYLDGYVPSQAMFVKTTSTRPNAFMAGAIARAEVNSDPIHPEQLAPLVQLLINNSAFNVPVDSNLITVLQGQQAYLRGATEAFLPLTTGPNPSSYTSAAVAAAVEGLTEQLFTRTGM